MTDSRTIGDVHDVRAQLGSEEKPLGRTTLQRLLINDPTFPRPFFVAGRRRWYMDELHDWLATRPRRQYADNAA